MTFALALWTALALGGASDTLSWETEVESPLGGVKWGHLGEGSEVTLTQTKGESRTVERRVLALVRGKQVAFDVTVGGATPVRTQQPRAPGRWALTDVLRVEQLTVAGHTYALEVRELRAWTGPSAKAGASTTTLWALRRAGRLMVVKTKRGEVVERTPVQLDARLTIDGRDFRCQHWREVKGATTLEAWECPGLPVPARELERSGAEESERVVTSANLVSPSSGDGP